MSYALSLFALVLLSGCELLVPVAHISKPNVSVGYGVPKISPDGRTAYFIKTVSQGETTMAYSVQGMFQGGYHEVGYAAWSRSFFCRSDSDGRNPVVTAKLPPEQFGAPVAFVVSWKEQKAIVCLNSLRYNIWFIDLKTGKYEWHTVSDPVPRSPTANPWDGFQWFYIDSIEDGSVFLWSIGDGLIGTMDFNGGVKQIDLRDHFEPVSGYSAESDRKMKEYEKKRHHFSRPMWNEEQRVFALKVEIGYNRVHKGGHDEIWVFNCKLEPVEKLSFEELSPVLQAKRQNRPPPEHKYAWVVEKLWDIDKSLGIGQRSSNAGIRKYPGPNAPDSYSDRYSFYDRYDAKEPNEFSLKDHSIEHKRMSPGDAVKIW